MLWLCDHTSSRPASSKRATAHEGAMAAWAIGGLVKRAWCRWLARAAAAGSGASSMRCSTAGCACSQACRFASSVRWSRGCQVASSSARARALTACSSRCATTPTKLPSRSTATTPGIAPMAARSSEASTLRPSGERTTRP
jgi:hypothetical protein